MIKITERAKVILVDLRASIADAGPDSALRLVANGKGELEIGIDVEKAGDAVVQHDGATLLLIEGAVSVGLAGSTIDCTPDGGLGLKLSSHGHDNGAS